VFTPPKDSVMSVWITSLVQTREVIQMILDKYKVESEPERFAIFVVKDSGGKITKSSFKHHNKTHENYFSSKKMHADPLT
jgi:Ras association (RalGDS/AF-6) domain